MLFQQTMLELGGVAYVRTRTTVAIANNKQYCGEDLYDDFVEKKPGAAAELEAFLNKVPQASNISPKSSCPSSAVSNVFSPTDLSTPLSPITEWPSPVSPGSPKRFDFPTLAAQQDPAGFVGNRDAWGFGEPLWLYTCLSSDKGTKMLRHLDMRPSRVQSDGDLALAVARTYSRARKGWHKTFSLRGVKSIRFVQVRTLTFH